MKKLMPLYNLISTESSAETTLLATSNWLLEQYPILSRFCIASVEGDEIYSFFVNDRLIDNRDDSFFQGRVSQSKTLSAISANGGVAYLSDIQSAAAICPQLNTIYRSGHRSSFTFAIKSEQRLIGFLFLNSEQVGAFDNPAVFDEFIQVAQLATQTKLYLYRRMVMLQSGLRLTLSMGHARDPETSQHLDRMSAYSVLIATHLAERNLVLSSDVVVVRRYARFHDIGKYQIQDDILFCTGRFTPSQREKMNQHCQFGVDIINKVERGMGVTDPTILERLKNIILHHHERFDGKGYPHGLAGEAIPIEARIVTVADVFDALLSERKYKGAWPLEKTVQFLRDNSGIMFDPDCVDALLAQLDQVKLIRARHVDTLD